MSQLAKIIESLRMLEESGASFVCVTLAAARGSVPQEVGAKMLVVESGRVGGTIGGSHRVQEGRMDRAIARIARLGAMEASD